jgi:hypothetical protein
MISLICIEDTPATKACRLWQGIRRCISVCRHVVRRRNTRPDPDRQAADNEQRRCSGPWTDGEGLTAERTSPFCLSCTHFWALAVGVIKTMTMPKRTAGSAFIAFVILLFPSLPTDAFHASSRSSTNLRWAQLRDPTNYKSTRRLCPLPCTVLR